MGCTPCMMSAAQTSTQWGLPRLSLHRKEGSVHLATCLAAVRITLPLQDTAAAKAIFTTVDAVSKLVRNGENRLNLRLHAPQPLNRLCPHSNLNQRHGHASFSAKKMILNFTGIFKKPTPSARQPQPVSYSPGQHTYCPDTARMPSSCSSAP